MNSSTLAMLIRTLCSKCGAPTVSSPLSTRPDLCWPCFLLTLGPSW
jgi:hypothetical protein